MDFFAIFAENRITDKIDIKNSGLDEHRCFLLLVTGLRQMKLVVLKAAVGWA